MPSVIDEEGSRVLTEGEVTALDLQWLMVEVGAEAQALASAIAGALDKGPTFWRLAASPKRLAFIEDVHYQLHVLSRALVKEGLLKESPPNRYVTTVPVDA